MALRNLQTLHYSPPLYEFEKDVELFTDSVRFFNFVEQNAVHVDAITYTFGRNPLTRLRRVITNIVCDKDSTRFVDQLRINTNVHSKVFYLFDSSNKLAYIFAGSLNLRLGLNYNLMFLLKSSLHKHMLAYMEALWKNSKTYDNKTISSQALRVEQANQRIRKSKEED